MGTDTLKASGQVPVPLSQVETPLTPQQIAEKARDSTVLVVMEDTNGLMLNSGSGFFVGPGMIATNLHVLDGIFKGYIKRIGMEGRENFEGIAAIDTELDLAILRIADVDAPVLPFGNSDTVQIGEPVYTTGNPEELEGTFSEGIISNIKEEDSGYYFQITAPISEGSSGGPVLNSKGEVIGVVESTITEGQNLNFAIPSDYLKALLAKV